MLGAIEIAVAGELELRGGFDERDTAGVGPLLVGDPQRARPTVVRVLAAYIVLGPLEIGQDVVMAPARTTERCPIVIVPVIAAYIDHRVDRR